MQHYTDKQSNFNVPGSTVIEAVRAAVEKYPALKFHVFDSQEHLRRHINLFVNDTNIRDLTGDVHSKEVEVKITNKAGADKSYRIQMRRYLLKDEVLNLNHNGRWVIVRFDPIEG